MRLVEKTNQMLMGLVTLAVLTLLTGCQGPATSSPNEVVVQFTEIPLSTEQVLATATTEPISEQTTVIPELALLYQAGREQWEIYEFTSLHSRLMTPGDLLYGQPFSPDRRKVVIAIEPLSRGEETESLYGIFDLDNGVLEPLSLLGRPRTVFWSPDGKQLMYVHSNEDAGQLVIYNFETEKNTPIMEDQSAWFTAGWSSDGSMAAFVSDTDGRYDLNIIEMDSLEMRRITDTIDIETAVIWSPVADELLVGVTTFHEHALESWPFGIDNIYLIDSEGNKTDLGSYGDVLVLSESLAWSTSGDSIAYADAGNLCLLTLDTGQRECPLENLPPYSDYYVAYGSPPVWSPDDKWLAFRAAGYRQNSCEGVYILELSTRQPIVVEEGSCKTGPVYWVGDRDQR